MTYNCYLCSHNAQSTIVETLISIVKQNILPENIFIYDDNSTDRTIELIPYHTASKKIHLLQSKAPASFANIPSNFNKMFMYAEYLNKRNVDYELIMADDIVLSKDYAESLLYYLDKHPNCAIASGEEIGQNHKAPRGIRMIRKSFFDKSIFRGYLYENMGYESSLSFEALRMGYTIQNLSYCRFIHKRPNGANHNFKTYGQAMKALDYDKLYVMGRFALNFIIQSDFPRNKTLTVLKSYLSYRNTKPYPKAFTDFVHSYQRKEMLRRLTR